MVSCQLFLYRYYVLCVAYFVENKGIFFGTLAKLASSQWIVLETKKRVENINYAIFKKNKIRLVALCGEVINETMDYITILYNGCGLIGNWSF